MTYCSVVTVLVLVALAKKRIGHHAILEILSLRSPSYYLMVGLHGMLKKNFGHCGLFFFDF